MMQASQIYSTAVTILGAMERLSFVSMLGCMAVNVTGTSMTRILATSALFLACQHHTICVPTNF